METALALQEAGCFSVVLECVPAPVAAAATSALKIPTIGIGAGPFCSGQVSSLFHWFDQGFKHASGEISILFFFFWVKRHCINYSNEHFGWPIKNSFYQL